MVSEKQRGELARFLGKEPTMQSLSPPNKEAARFWTIDPIDGTKGYLRGGQYAVCVALVEEGSVVVSVLSCPRLSNSMNDAPGTAFIAVKSMGAHEISLVSGQYQKLPAFPPRRGTAGAILTESLESRHADYTVSAALAQKLQLDPVPMRMDSQCKYGLVARGQAHIYLRQPKCREYKERIWDHAPGTLIVVEAGGYVTDFAGQPLRFSPNASLKLHGGILVTNLGKAHETILVALRK